MSSRALIQGKYTAFLGLGTPSLTSEDPPESGQTPVSWLLGSAPLWPRLLSQLPDAEAEVLFQQHEPWCCGERGLAVEVWLKLSK